MRIRVLAGFMGMCLVAAPATPQERPERRVTVPAPVSVVAFAEDGRSAVAWDPMGYSIWNLESGRMTRREPVLAKACGRTAALPRSDDGVTVGVNCRGKLLFFEVATGKAIGEWTLGETRASTAFAVAADGSFAAVVVAGALDTVELLDRDGKPQARLKARQEVERVSVTRDGRFVAAGSVEGIEVWRVPAADTATAIQGRAPHAFSGDARTIVVARAGGATLHSMEDGGAIRQLEGLANEVRYGGGGQVVGWTNQQVIVWDEQSGAQRLVLKSDQFVTAGMSADGTRLATISLELRGDAASSILAIWRVPARQ